MQNLPAFLWGSLIAMLGGLIGLGGAEFRLPVLVSVFRFQTLSAIVLNLIVRLVTVVFSFFFRLGAVGFYQIAANMPVILNILAGSLIGSFFGVQMAVKIDAKALKRPVVILLVCLSFVLVSHDFIFQSGFAIAPLPRLVLGFLCGLVIGTVSSLLGVAGGELIIPTIVILYGVDIKLAGSLSLAISIPTILMGLARYRQKSEVHDLRSEAPFIAAMCLGSILGAFAGSYLLPYVASFFLHFLGGILLISALKMELTKHA